MPSSSDKVRELNRVRRVIFLLVAIVVVAPYIIRPKPMPFTPTKDAKVLFDKIDALPRGSHVLLSIDYDPSSQAELYPMSQALLRHCFRKGLVPIVMTHVINGVNLARDLTENAAAENWQTVSRCVKSAGFPCRKKDLLKYVLDRSGQFSKEHVAYQGVIDVLDRLDKDRSYKDLEDVHAEDIFRKIPDQEMQSGRDFVFLGFKTGGGQLILSMGMNLKGAFEEDYYSQPTTGMPALKGVDSLKNINFALDFAASGIVNTWMMFGSDRFGFPLGAGTTAVMAPDLIPFVQSGQIAGFLGGLRGAADYEKMLDRPADGSLGMWAQSSTHVLVILLILIANVRLLAHRWSGKGKD